MADSGAPSLGRCSMSTASKKAMKRRGPSVASEPSSNSMAAEAAADSVDTVAAAAVGKKKNMKWRMPQNQVDFILSWDVSVRVPRASDNIDNLPASDEFKERYRANQLRSAALMREISRKRREMQEFVKAQLEEHGYVEVETDSEMFVQ